MSVAAGLSGGPAGAAPWKGLIDASLGAEGPKGVPPLDSPRAEVLAACVGAGQRDGPLAQPLYTSPYRVSPMDLYMES